MFSNHVFHYRVSIYNYFDSYFNNHGYEMSVVAPSVQKNNPHTINFKLQLVSYNLFKINYLFKFIKQSNLFSVIFFLHLKDIVFWPLIIYCKINKIKIIYWNHGVNLQDPNNKIKYIFHNFLHTISDKIILYSENEKKYLSKKNKEKVIIAPNTINFDALPSISQSKKELHKKYKITYEKIALFVGRITPEKRVDYLIDLFKDHRLNNYLLIIVGSGLSNKLIKCIKQISNITYYGEIMDLVSINEIFKMSDIFVHPGAIGLSLNQAFYWGLPVITEDVFHGPEIIYLKNNNNGFKVKHNAKNDFIEKIQLLFNNSKLLDQFSQSSKATIIKEANIDIMANGFITAFNTLK